MKMNKKVNSDAQQQSYIKGEEVSNIFRVTAVAIITSKEMTKVISGNPTYPNMR